MKITPYKDQYVKWILLMRGNKGMFSQHNSRVQILNLLSIWKNIYEFSLSHSSRDGKNKNPIGTIQYLSYGDSDEGIANPIEISFTNDFY